MKTIKKKQPYKPLKSKEAALISASIASEKKGLEITILNVEKLSSLSDYMIICSGSSDRQVRAITDGIIEKLKELGKKPLDVEGYKEGKWVLIDFDDLLIHIFYEPLRSYYRIEELWQEAKKLKLPKL